MIEAIEGVRKVAGVFIAIDGPEYALQSGTGEDTVRVFARELGIGIRATGLRAVVNLNSALAPPWAEGLAEGPLFAASQRAAEASPAVDAGGFCEPVASARAGPGPIRIDWHVSARDSGTDGEAHLLRLARRALDGAAVTFVFDRSRRPLALAEGLDRTHPAVLLYIGLHLPRLAEQLGGRPEPSSYLHKLESLTRLALSAAAQKRDFLRRSGRPWPGFLLDRARLVVVPVGLDAVVRRLLDMPVCSGGPALEFACEVVQRLRDVLRNDGRSYHLESCVDSAEDFSLARVGGALDASHSSTLLAAEHVAGLTPWDASASPREQLRAAGALHAAAEAGTAAVLLPDDRRLAAEQLVELLLYAWRQTQIVRLRVVRPSQPLRQIMAPWEASGPGPP
jgi:hypothetical protein